MLFWVLILFICVLGVTHEPNQHWLALIADHRVLREAVKFKARSGLFTRFEKTLCIAIRFCQFPLVVYFDLLLELGEIRNHGRPFEVGAFVLVQPNFVADSPFFYNEQLTYRRRSQSLVLLLLFRFFGIIRLINFI